MALTRNGVAVGTAQRNGVTLDKVTVNGTTVWENWRLLTGYYNRMTSANTPFTVTTTSTANFKDPYVLFDDDWTTNPTFNVGDGQGNKMTIVQDLIDTKIIPVKIEVLTNNKTTSAATFESTNTLYVSDDKQNWIEFGSYTYIAHSLQTNTTKVLTKTLDKPIRYVKLEIKRKTSSTNVQTGGHGFRIVEWYQKGA